MGEWQPSMSVDRRLAVPKRGDSSWQGKSWSAELAGELRAGLASRDVDTVVELARGGGAAGCRGRECSSATVCPHWNTLRQCGR
jgi:hypothetical protein